MEKKEVPTTVVMSYDDTQSTYTMEQPPPAYKKPESSSVKITKMIIGAVLALSVILGAVVLGAVYIQTKNQCVLLPPAMPFDTLAAESAPIAEALHQAPSESREEINLLDADRLHIPLQLDIDDLTGQMMENNQRARVNCLIEKKKAEEIVTQTPKHLRTPFGNLTTDHRYMHVTGETMSLSCRSGNAHIFRPSQSEEDQQQPQHPAATIIQVQGLHQMPAQARMGHPPPPQHMQPQMHHPHPAMANHPLMMGPGGPMPPPPHAFMVNPREMHDPRMEQHFRAKRRVKQCACACDC